MNYNKTKKDISKLVLRIIKTAEEVEMMQHALNGIAANGPSFDSFEVDTTMGMDSLEHAVLALNNAVEHLSHQGIISMIKGDE